MNVNDLTSLQSCKDYLAIGNSLSDAALARLITSQSRNFLSLTNRQTFAPTTKSVILDGNGSDVMMIVDFPLISVASLNIDGTPIPPGPSTPPPPGTGFYFDADGRITLVGGGFTRIGGEFGGGPWGGSAGFWFTRARKNVFITYTFGFAGIPVLLELQTIPTVGAPVITLNNAFWISDQGVQFFIGGTPLTQVFVAPSAGQYYVNTQTGQYTFAAADAGKQVQISYTYSGVPDDVQQCVNGMVGFVYGQRGSVGVQSETISGAAATVRLQDYPKYLWQTIYYYRRHFRGPSS